MRERHGVQINRLTGERTETLEILPAASLAERIASQKAAGELSMLGHGPVLKRSAYFRCDGPCGVMVEVDYDQPELPAGWVSRDDGEFCPECR